MSIDSFLASLFGMGDPHEKTLRDRAKMSVADAEMVHRSARGCYDGLSESVEAENMDLLHAHGRELDLRMSPVGTPHCKWKKHEVRGFYVPDCLGVPMRFSCEKLLDGVSYIFEPNFGYHSIGRQTVSVGPMFFGYCPLCGREVELA